MAAVFGKYYLQLPIKNENNKSLGLYEVVCNIDVNKACRLLYVNNSNHLMETLGEAYCNDIGCIDTTNKQKD